MEKFNIKRFCNTFKWFFCENRGYCLKWLLGIMLATTLIQMGLIIMAMHNVATVENQQPVGPYTIAVALANSMCILLVFISLLVVCTNVFAMLKNKQKRIAFLTLPATNLERWTTAILFAVILMPVCVVLAYVLGDVLRNIVFCVQGKEWLFGVDTFMERIATVSKRSLFGYLFKGAIWLWVLSLYVLGGTWFRKGAFVYVSTFLIALTTLLGYLANVFKSEILTFLVDGVSKGQEDYIAYSLLVVVTALAIFHFWLSYRIFTRFQLITSKWTNV